MPFQETSKLSMQAKSCRREDFFIRFTISQTINKTKINHFFGDEIFFTHSPTTGIVGWYRWSTGRDFLYTCSLQPCLNFDDLPKTKIIWTGTCFLHRFWCRTSCVLRASFPIMSTAGCEHTGQINNRPQHLLIQCKAGSQPVKSARAQRMGWQDSRHKHLKLYRSYWWSMKLAACNIALKATGGALQQIHFPAF